MWGIPIAHKDLFETRGIRTTAGSLLYERQHPRHQRRDRRSNSSAPARCMLGKTNTHELGGGVTTINPFFGTTRNPSIGRASPADRAAGRRRRWPRNSVGGDRQRHRRQRAHSGGVLRLRRLQADVRARQHARPARRVPDVRSRRLADAHRRGCGRCCYAARRCAASARRDGDVRGLRVGVPRAYFFEDLDPAVASGGVAIERLVSKAHVIADVALPDRRRTMARCSIRSWSSRSGDGLAPTGAPPRLVLEDVRRLLLDAAPVDRRVRSRARRAQGVQAAVDRLFDSVDVIVTPTVPVHGAADRRPDRRHEDSPQHLAVQRRRQAGHLDPAGNQRRSAGWAAAHRRAGQRRQTVTNGRQFVSRLPRRIALREADCIYFADAQTSLARPSSSWRSALRSPRRRRRRPAAPKVTTPEDILRPRHRRRLRPAELHPVHRVLAEARRRVGPHDRRSRSARPPRAATS